MLYNIILRFISIDTCSYSSFHFHCRIIFYCFLYICIFSYHLVVYFVYVPFFSFFFPLHFNLFDWDFNIFTFDTFFSSTCLEILHSISILLAIALVIFNYKTLKHFNSNHSSQLLFSCFAILLVLPDALQNVRHYYCCFINSTFV